MRIKYPRTLHLPWSPGVSSDDRVLHDLSCFTNKEVVVTTKMDGENTTLYADGFHARSIDGRHHSSRDWLANWHANIAHNIPPGWRVCGENLFARHSIEYTALPSYFQGFSIWDEHNCALGWDATITWFELLDIIPVPVIWRGVFNETVLKKLAREIDTSSTEGFVVRLTSAFDYSKFSTSVAKWVRTQHVTSTTHWARSVIVPNILQKCNNV